MFPLDYLLAASLLFAPPDAAESRHVIEQHLSLAPAIQEMALAWEILDARERPFVLTRKEDFKTDLHLLRCRQRDLANAPSLHECLRFPDKKAVTDLLSFNRAYRKYLEKRQYLEATHHWQFQEALRETDRLYQIWDAIRDTRCDYYYITLRRSALKKVRDMVGHEAYYNGNYPPHVPLWRFQTIE